MNPIFRKYKHLYLALGIILLSLTQGCITPPTASSTATSPIVNRGFDRSALQSATTPRPGTQYSGSRERVVWVGIATTVSWSEIPNRFPNLTLSGGGSADSALLGVEQEITAFFKSKQFSGFDIVDASEQRDSDIALALLLNKERYSQEKSFSGGYMVEYGLLGELVFIDQKNQTIIGSYPIGSKIRDLTKSLPDSEKIKEMVDEVLLAKADGSGSSSSIVGQFKQALADQHVSPRPRYCFEVGEVTLGDSCREPVFFGKTGKMSFDAEKLELWRGDIGTVFASDLGNNTGLSFNPYVSRRGNSDNILALHFKRDASRVIMANAPVSLRLPDPVRKFNIRIDSLNCEVDPEWTGKYVVNVIYGFVGSLSVIEPTTERAIGVYPFDVSLKGFKGLPKDMREVYWHNSRRKLTPDMFNAADYDQERCWKNSLENFLDQKTAEMLFEKADKASNYKALRDDLGKIGAVIQN